jgi:peptide/nickel transport system substrate-binding protein
VTNDQPARDPRADSKVDLNSPISRRNFVRGAAAGVGTLAGASLLGPWAASADARRPVASTAASKPKRGGTLRAGFTGGTSADTIDPYTTTDNCDYARVFQLYEPLVGINAAAQPYLLLAEEIEPNKTATEWTIRIKKGLTFHNGKEATSEDLLYSMQVATNSKLSYGTPAVTPVDVKGMRKLDKYTIRVPCTTPFSTFMDNLSNPYFWLIPAGWNPKKPVGTGPFKFKSFTPGVQSHFTRNENYWQTGLPYLDGIVISDYSDETTQANGILGGQVDVVNFLSGTSVAALKNGGAQTSVMNGGQWSPFCMNVNVAPFNDVRVRQAFRLLVDRHQFLETVFSGYGSVANDLYCQFDPVYDRALPQRKQDIEKAKSLLKAAGHESLSVQLVTADLAQGVTQSAPVFAQQAAAAGVKVSVRVVTPTVLYGPQYKKWPFSMDTWGYVPFFPTLSYANLPTGPFNETHYGPSSFLKLYQQAQRTIDDGARKELAHEMQTMLYNDGGYVIPIFSPTIDGFTKRVNGTSQSKAGFPFNFYDFRNTWLS